MIGHLQLGALRIRMSENAFNSRSRTIGELLASNQPARIMVPTFQRGYSWESKHVRAFWHDITDSKRSKKYFLGPIVILDKPGSIIELLDGQQHRLLLPTMSPHGVLPCYLRYLSRRVSHAAPCRPAKQTARGTTP